LYYRKQLLEFVLSTLDDSSATEALRNVTLMHSIDWIKRSWFDKVRDETVVNCLLLCRIHKNVVEEAPMQEPPQSNALVDELMQLAESIGVEEFDITEEIPDIFRQSDNWEEDILNPKPVRAQQDNVDDNGSDDELPIVSWKEFQTAWKVVRNNAFYVKRSR